MKIKTRESLKTIKTFDCADMLAQKSKNGVSSLHNSAEQTQGAGYESETEYAGDELQDKEEWIGKSFLYGVKQVSKWGIRETRKNILKWRNRPRKQNANSKLKQLTSPQRKPLQAPKKGIKVASKGTKNAAKGCKSAAKGAKTTAKTTTKAVKATAKAAQKAAQATKAAIKATIQFVKVVVKAIIAAAKATVAAIKGIIAAIAAGGWVVVLIIVIIVLVGLVVGSVYAIFVPADDNSITIYSVMSDLEREYHQRQVELVADCHYDILNYEGELAGWNEIIAVYAVKLNLGDEPQEVATFDKNKETEFKAIFWDMNDIFLRTETKTSYVTKQITDIDGNTIKVTEEIKTIYLTVVTSNRNAEQIANKYGFTAKQHEMLDELLSEGNAELWTEILGEYTS